MAAVVTKVPAHVWRMIIASVGRNTRGRVENLLMLLTVNKEIVVIAREELVKLGRLMIQCTVAQIPHAISAFATATEMRVVGSKTTRSMESEDMAARVARAARDASAASAALAASGRRFRVLESDHTDESNMGWLPQQKMLGQQKKKPSEERGEPSEERGGGGGPAARDQNEEEEEEGRCVVVCNVSATRFSGPKVLKVAGFCRTGRMGELVIRHRGLRNHKLPDLSVFDSDGVDSDGPVGPLRVTIENWDFHGLDDGCDGPKFRSPVVTELAFVGCDLVLLPSLCGFPKLERLEVVNCHLNEYDALSLLPSAHDQIEYLRVERCGGDHDGSPIAGLTKLKTLVMTDCTGREYPDFDEAARDSLHGRLVGGELNGGGRGLLCKEIARRLQVECCAGLAMCDADYCDCGGGSSDGE